MLYNIYDFVIVVYNIILDDIALGKSDIPSALS